ncbi:MAG: 2OG-Fe(II) oxygenase family protein [Caulobacteraceae bacterium]
MLQLDKLAERPTTTTPFPHLTATGLLPEEAKADLARDFPDESKTGFFPVEQLTYGPAFAKLLEDLRAPEFSRIVGEKLDRDLVNRPKMIVVRKWSASKDGRPHTDGQDKVATALVYLNDDWGSEGGALRFLASSDIDGPGTDPIPARYGGFAAFARADDSWHGHKPFAGERRVVQVFWLQDEDAAARKTKRHKRTNFLKAIWPF